MTLTPAICRAARAYMNLNQSAFAQKAGVGLSTLRDFERGSRQPIRQNINAIERTFRDAGINLESLEAAFQDFDSASLNS